MLAVFGSFCARQCAYEDNIQLNLSTTATMGTDERGRCKEVLNKSQCMDFFSAGTTKVAVIERWLLSKVQLYQRIPNMVVLPMMEH